MAVGEKIQEIRIEYGYSLEGLSSVTGINIETLTSIEFGIKRPTKKTLRRIAEALDVSPATLS